MFLLSEIVAMIITALAMGYMFKGILPETGDEKKDFTRSTFIGGAAIILHELAHKFVATYFGGVAVYNANLPGLGLGVLLRYMNFPIFVVPAYVSIRGGLSGLAFSLTALAGPLTNLALFGVARLLVDKHLLETPDQFMMAHVFAKINLWLFIFNILPIPGFDGFQAITSLLR